jgi:hypothetical protein
MRRRFGYRPYFKLSELNIAIKLELISSPPGHPLASGVTEASILRAAAEIGAIYVNKKWPKNLKQEPVFINAQMGDKYDVVKENYFYILIMRIYSFVVMLLIFLKNLIPSNLLNYVLVLKLQIKHNNFQYMK